MPRVRRSNIGRKTRKAYSLQRYRAKLTAQQLYDRNERERIRSSQTREARKLNSTNKKKRSSDPSIDYSNSECIDIGSMNSVSSHCNELKHQTEDSEVCSANDKVECIPLDPPPEPLYSLVSEIEIDSKDSLTNIQQYNNCQMTSFKATDVVRENSTPTVKVEDEIENAEPAQ